MPIYKLKNPILPYAWGTKDFIPNLLGIKPDGKPWAEMWMGAHPKAPSVITVEDKKMPLDQFLPDFPILFKVLTAQEPLSIQVHPDKNQAIIGFKKENKLGIPIDAPKRNYRDNNHKPELFVALTDFTALVGFQSIDKINKNMKILLPKHKNHATIKDFYQEMMTLNEEEKITVLDEAIKNAEDFPWIEKLNKCYPNDIGILAPAYLNLVELKPGQCMFAPAGVLHVYLHGTILELMANSDNVLRGGLTQKHVDVPELLDILKFEKSEPELIAPKRIGNEKVYTSDEFEVSQLIDGFQTTTQSNEILLCIDGTGKLNNKKIKKGESYLITKGQKYLFKGDAKVYRACTTVSPSEK